VEGGLKAAGLTAIWTRGPRQEYDRRTEGFSMPPVPNGVIGSDQRFYIDVIIANSSIFVLQIQILDVKFVNITIERSSAI